MRLNSIISSGPVVLQEKLGWRADKTRQDVVIHFDGIELVFQTLENNIVLKLPVSDIRSFKVVGSVIIIYRHSQKGFMQVIYGAPNTFLKAINFDYLNMFGYKKKLNESNLDTLLNSVGNAIGQTKTY